MPFGIPSEQIVDAEVISDASVSRPPPNPNVVNLQSAYDPLNGSQMVDGYADPYQLALVEKRARALSIFVRLPFFFAIALNGRVPALFRLAAVGLGVLEATQLARDNHLAAQYLPQEQP